MAKRKAARTTRRASKKAPSRRSGQAGRKASGGRKAAAKKKASSKKKARPKRPAPKPRAVAKRSSTAARPAPRPRVAARKAAKPVARKSSASRPAAATRKVVTRPAAPAAGKRTAVPLMRKPPSLDRERRIISDEDDIIQSTPPSSLDLDRSASAVRTGRRALKDRFEEHTETSPALTAGDVDADWESAYSEIG